MASSAKQAIAKAAREIFGHAPQKNIRTGRRVLKQTLTGPYIARYYPETTFNMDAAARKTLPGYTTEQQQRRLDKLDTLRRRGKGPPKKGSGKRQQKK